jgi:hypothetical protein
VSVYYEQISEDTEPVFDWLVSTAIRIYYPVQKQWVRQPRRNVDHYETTLPLVQIQTEDLGKWLKSKIDLFPREELVYPGRPTFWGNYIVIFQGGEKDGKLTLGVYHDSRDLKNGFRHPGQFEFDFPLPLDEEVLPPRRGHRYKKGHPPFNKKKDSLP